MTLSDLEFLRRGEEEEEEEEEEPTGPIVTRLKRGFYVTVERIIIEDGHRWVRTSELNYVDAQAISKRRVADIHGTELVLRAAARHGRPVFLARMAVTRCTLFSIFAPKAPP